ncbi:bifunctional GTP diphosphokinase/guanosine-3',5'-bis pyrophosphate 3'-pyrophosphohydrolase [Pseudomonas phage EM]|uniref:Bifunctional GTP diphosphokinase/guanosine-3',5'-bis pyrophosphate 3'-pyrophosphohydrolase n=1 Tax=Pseudomonas phage EM TaxID=2936914 RepID=A0AAE9KSI8_9CAUD|nr:bifunctional GTP diphosphokinase/guanosine-3',5'-bis pyrophosphate 3'-pyrophosphohydrolase [Pseudomonas phage EM]UPW35838.1 bifunctional GTP diphosphokinase/guanosine-3',5'-bis pyrophosphate 3'-pyrophosphohydrolase [Pseudomonas phage EM]
MLSQIEIALEIASNAHEGQMYGDSKVPYMYHLQMVYGVAVARNAPADMDSTQQYHTIPKLNTLLSVALLHDVLEDTLLTADDLSMMGVWDNIVEALVILNKNNFETYKKYMIACRSHPVAKEIKICDTISNLSMSTMEGRTGRIKKYSSQLNILMKEEFPSKIRKKNVFEGYLGEDYYVGE